MRRTTTLRETFQTSEKLINSLWTSRRRQEAIKKTQEVHFSMKPHIIRDYLSEKIGDFLYHEKLLAMSRMYYEQIVHQKSFDKYPKEFCHRVLLKLSKVWKESNSLPNIHPLDEKDDFMAEEQIFDYSSYEKRAIMINPYLKALPKRHFVIGDVHGCCDELNQILDKCNFDPTADQLIFVGDIIGKGPYSNKVVRLVRSLGSIVVKGNHENYLNQHWISKTRGENPVFELIPSYQEIANEMTEDEFGWMLTLPLTYEFENKVVVHAGLVPEVPIEDQSVYDMMNMRNIHNGKAIYSIDQGFPWGMIYSGKEVIFGHDAVRKLQIHPHAIGLDTGCVYGGELTAFILPERKFVSIKANRVYHEAGKKYY